MYLVGGNDMIYVFSSGKFLNMRKYAGVKDLTNMMMMMITNKLGLF